MYNSALILTSWCMHWALPWDTCGFRTPHLPSQEIRRLLVHKCKTMTFLWGPGGKKEGQFPEQEAGLWEYDGIPPLEKISYSTNHGIAQKPLILPERKGMLFRSLISSESRANTLSQQYVFIAYCSILHEFQVFKSHTWISDDRQIVVELDNAPKKAIYGFQFHVLGITFKYKAKLTG